MKKEKTASNAARPNGQPDQPNVFHPIQSCLPTEGIDEMSGLIGKKMLEKGKCNTGLWG